MNDIHSKKWHTLTPDETVILLKSNKENGLAFSEIKIRQQQYGPNTLSVKKGRSPLLRFLLQFHQPLIYILIASGFITAALHEWVDSGVIFGVVIVNAIVGYIQEAKAVNALAALSRIMTTEATVLRRGEKIRVPATDLTIGDIVSLKGGDKVPADMRLIKVRELQIDESALTGESLPVTKLSNVLPDDALLADRGNMAYASTLVTFGEGTGIVVAIGDNTEVGIISQLISSSEELATPLTRKIAQFSHMLLYVILGLSALTIVVGVLRGQTFIDMFMAAVALAVGAIPEGLPAAVTITLAIGVSRMARRNAIIRKLPAVETLGSTTVICSDKTGTLTENQMTVKGVHAGGIHYLVSGGGYDPNNGSFESKGNKIKLLQHPALTQCLLAGVLCNDSRLIKDDSGNMQIQGDPTEGALLVSALKAGILYDHEMQNHPRLDVIPFESEHQYMATLHQTEVNSSNTIFLKGGVETVLAKCRDQLDGKGNQVPLQEVDILAQLKKLTAKGERVLAFARKDVLQETSNINHADVASDMTFIGLQGMLDPPRAAAVSAVKTCQGAGIRVKMITGDHPLTAAAIAQQIGLDNSQKQEEIAVLTGKDLTNLSDQELIDKAENITVFARATPEQKLRLVKAFQAKGHVVAMTGDGVNDAPALKQADIGVAMGITGTEVAKEAADMVLTDDNFTSIEAAVEEGRGVFDNLTKFIVWTLPTNLGEGLVILFAIFLGITLPILPVQILWINMTTAGFLGLMLAFEPKEPGIMLRSPRNPQTPILTSCLNVRIILVGALLLFAAFGLFQWELHSGASLAEARTVAVNAFVIVELCYLLNCRSLQKSIFELGLFTNQWVFAGATFMLLLQIVYTYAPFMNRLFQSAPITPHAWIKIFGSGIIAYLIVELEKRIRRSMKPS